MRAHSKALPLVASFALFVTGCSQLPRQAETPEGGAGASAEKAKVDSSKDPKKSKKKDKIRDKTRELEKKERALHLAQLELKVSRQDADADGRKQEFDLEVAALALEEVEKELALFRDVERPMKEAERRLAVDRAQRRLHEARTDLAGIRAIYEEEPEASAKDEIILRHERDVEFAERSLGIQEKRSTLALENEDLRRERELGAKLSKAQRTLEAAGGSKERARIKGEIGVLRKEHALVELEEELEDLRAELKKLKKGTGE